MEKMQSNMNERSDLVERKRVKILFDGENYFTYKEPALQVNKFFAPQHFALLTSLEFAILARRFKGVVSDIMSAVELLKNDI